MNSSLAHGLAWTFCAFVCSNSSPNITAFQDIETFLMFIGCVCVLCSRYISSERFALASRTMGSSSMPSRMSTPTRRRSRCGSPGVALVALTVALASAGCSAAADRAAFVGGTGARTLLSSSARASCVPRTRRPGERDGGTGAQRACCGCFGVISCVRAVVVACVCCSR